MRVLRWERDYPLTVNEAKFELQAEGMTPYRFDFQAGLHYPPHAHAHTEILIIITGAMTTGEAGMEGVLLRPGDRVEIPPRMEHWMRVVGEEDVVSVRAEKEG